MSENTETPKVRGKLGQWFVDLWKKTLLFLNQQFTGIFEKGKIFYTLIFFGAAIVIAFFSLGKNASGQGVINATIIITLTLTLGFLFLMICAFIPALSKHLFDRESLFTKIIITIIAFMLAFIIALLWLLYGNDPLKITLPFFRFTQLFSYLFIVVFIGWNILQIHFIKDGINSLANSGETRLIVEQVEPKKKNVAAIGFLVLSLIIPLLAHFFTSWVFWADAQNLASEDVNAPAKYIAWVVVIGIIFLGMDAWQVWLFVRSKKYGHMNVYSSLLYLLVSLVIWFRTYGFITSFLDALSTPGTTFVTAFGNILLVILTAVFVLRMIAREVKETKKMNVDAIPFLVFALVLMYIAGQVVMILGSLESNQYLVNVTNSSILLISSIVYYLWYSQFILQRKDYIKRTRYTVEEIKGVLVQFADEIKESSPSEVENIDTALTSILDEHKIEIIKKKE